MTRKITDQSEEDETVIDVGYEDATGLKDDQDEMEAQILAQFDADEENVEWTVSIYEVGTKGEKDGWLFDCSMGDIIGVRQKLLDIYGTGLYRARIRRGNRLARFLTYRIVAPRIGPQAVGLESPNPLAIAVKDQGRLLENLVDRLGQIPPTPVQDNPLQMIDVMGRMMETMGRFMPQPVAPVNPTIDPMQMFELIFRGMEMGKENSGGDSNVIDLIRDVLKGVDLGSILSPPQIAAPGQRISGPQIPLVAPENVPVITPTRPGQVPTAKNVAPEAIPDPAQEIDPVVSGIVSHLAQFIPHAQRGADPALYADVILDNAPRDAIKHVVSYPDIEAIFQASNPAIAENWDWFDMLLNELRDALSETNLTPAPEDDTGDRSGEEIQGQIIEADQATDVPKPNEQPTPSGSNGDPERQGRHKGDVAGNGDADKGGKEKPGSKNKGG